MEEIQTPTPVVDAPIQTPAADVTNVAPQMDGSAPPTKNKRVIKIIVAVFGVVLAVGGLFTAVSLADAYQKLPFSHPVTSNFGKSLIVNIPFLPKTPELVIEKSVEVHKYVSTADFIVSLATESQSFSEFLGSSDVDVVVEGQVDWTDKDNPVGSADFNVSNQFRAKSVMLPDQLYLQINQVPQSLLGMASVYTSLDPVMISDALLDKWVFFDQSSPRNEARNSLNETKDSETAFDEFYQDLMEVFAQENISDNVSMEQTEKDGVRVYHIAAEFNGNEIEDILNAMSEKDDKYEVFSTGMNYSEILKKLNINAYIDQKTFYLHTLNINFEYDNQATLNTYRSSGLGAASLLQPEKYRVALSLQLLNVGKVVSVQAPAYSIPLEDFIAQLGQLVGAE